MNTDIEDFRWRELRHSAAIKLAMNGVPLHEIADILVHKSMDMMIQFIHLAENHTAEIIKKMNDKMFAS